MSKTAFEIIDEILKKESKMTPENKVSKEYEYFGFVDDQLVKFESSKEFIESYINAMKNGIKGEVIEDASLIRKGQKSPSIEVDKFYFVRDIEMGVVYPISVLLLAKPDLLMVIKKLAAISAGSVLLQVLKTTDGVCFRLSGEGIVKIHWVPYVNDIDDAFIFVRNMVKELEKQKIEVFIRDDFKDWLRGRIQSRVNEVFSEKDFDSVRDYIKKELALEEDYW